MYRKRREEPQYIEYKHRNTTRRMLNPLWVAAQAKAAKKLDNERAKLRVHLTSAQRDGFALCGLEVSDVRYKVTTKLQDATCGACKRYCERYHMHGYYEP